MAGQVKIRRDLGGEDARPVLVADDRADGLSGVVLAGQLDGICGTAGADDLDLIHQAGILAAARGLRREHQGAAAQLPGRAQRIGGNTGVLTQHEEDLAVHHVPP